MNSTEYNKRLLHLYEKYEPKEGIKYRGETKRTFRLICQILARNSKTIDDFEYKDDFVDFMKDNMPISASITSIRKVSSKICPELKSRLYFSMRNKQIENIANTIAESDFLKHPSYCWVLAEKIYDQHLYGGLKKIQRNKLTDDQYPEYAGANGPDTAQQTPDNTNGIFLKGNIFCLNEEESINLRSYNIGTKKKDGLWGLITDIYLSKPNDYEYLLNKENTNLVEILRKHPELIVSQNSNDLEFFKKIIN